ncbi:unnamed protein product [Clonostachys rosea f. rosea IK726]|uniref:Uncharacterized protein n=1 Tax=Clonostachys rosea f. rosea IK726 TaxID=1349383 RepID=A0ACA9UI22_BIOOC|nr:unnamed protein product [Clonostachys rosea f. rosea IK726]
MLHRLHNCRRTLAREIPPWQRHPDNNETVNAQNKGQDGGPLITLQSSRNSPEPSQTDQQGHYVGPASGVSFLLRIRRKLQVPSTGYLSSSIFNFGDRPLPGHDASFVILPPKHAADAMVKRYFDFAATTHRFLHRPTIDSWLEELYGTNGAMLYQESARSRIAVLARYFAVAEHQLSMEKGQIKLSNVQARLAQCFYLLAQSRLNHCWTLFGITAHLALALGIHRKSRVDANTSNRVDHIDLECRKRTFWCAYNLNTYLSAALGRPMTFHDEDIDQELPLGIDDERLRSSPPPGPSMLGPSITSATVAQIKLSRILARILRVLYGIHPPSTEEQFTLTAKFSRDLEEWREHISYLLDTDGNSAIFVRLVLRQRDVLKLAFWHAQILVNRQFLLKTFTSLANYEPRAGGPLAQRKEEVQKNVKTCIEAAEHIIEHIDRISAAGELYSTLFFIPYYGFNAVVILYLYAIQERSERPETYLRHFRAGSKCHAQLEKIATHGSLMQRYGVVLQELRLEVLRNNAYLASVSTPHAEEDSAEGEIRERRGEVARTMSVSNPAPEPPHPFGAPSMSASASRLGVASAQGLEGPRSGNEDASCIVPAANPGSMDGMDDSLTHMASWGLFDSLVTGGTGTLDMMWDNMNLTGFNNW